MASSFTIKVEGLSEVNAALGQLSKAVSKAVMQRAGINALTPMRDDARAHAPDDPTTTAQIADTIQISTKRPAGSKSAAAQAFAAAGGGAAGRAASKAAGGSVEIFMGPDRAPKNTQQEFGNSRHGPQPYMRPAWDANKDAVPRAIGRELWVEIDKAAARAARKTARLAAKAAAVG